MARTLLHALEILSGEINWSIRLVNLAFFLFPFFIFHVENFGTLDTLLHRSALSRNDQIPKIPSSGKIRQWNFESSRESRAPIM